MINSALTPANFSVKSYKSPPTRLIWLKPLSMLPRKSIPSWISGTYLVMLDRMADTLQQRLPETSYPLKIIRTINQYVFDELNFRGNTIDYYDPRNSFLNEVLTRRVGYRLPYPWCI
jgi:hypothetical protein